MRRLIIAAAFTLLWAASSFAQTVVNLSVTDTPDNQTWNNGTWQAQLIPAPGNPSQTRTFVLLSGGGSLANQSGGLSATGTASMLLPANVNIAPIGTVWQFTVCSQQGTSCSIANITITTSSPQSVTISPLSIRVASIPNLPPVVVYTTNEISSAAIGSQITLVGSIPATPALQICIAVSGTTCTTWASASGATLPGGSPIQTQVNNGGLFGGTPCENFNNLSTGPENVDCDWHSKGPNPWVDITRFGARACNPSTTPCASGLTASINLNSNQATISSASTFINGDGVVIYGAGPAANVTSAPTGLAVTNVLSNGGTGTGLTTASAAGTSTRCYKVIARDTGGGFTAASSEVCNTTSLATLGAVTVNISSCTRSIITVTCTTTSATPLLVGNNLGEVYIGGSPSDVTFRGWRSISSAVDSTHFTFVDNAINTNYGATTSETGGTATFFAANHVTWNAVTNAWLYYVYEGASGAETLIGVSRPQGAFAGVTDTTFDDFGTPFTSNITFPAWIPTTPPLVGGNDNLSTTITSGAGTTTLTLATNAGATVSNVGIRLDAAPALRAAAAATNFVGPLFVPSDPSNNSFVVNSFCDLTSIRLSVIQSGQLWLHETIALQGAGLRWAGDRITTTGSSGGGGANSWGTYPKIFVTEAVPGIYLNSGFGYSWEGVDLQGLNPNGVLLMLVENGFNGSFKDDRWNDSTGNNDLMGFGLILRGVNAQSAAGIVMDKVSFSGGTGVDGGSHNTPFFCNKGGDINIRRAYATGRGIIYNPNSIAGIGSFRIEEIHYNGGFTPLVTIAGGPTNVLLGNFGEPVIMDTVGHPCVSFINAIGSVANNGCAPTGYIFASPSVTGSATLVSGGGLFINAQQANTALVTAENGLASIAYNVTGPGGISVGSSDSIWVNGPPIASAPTCSVSAGGSALIGSFVFFVQPVWWNGQEGALSPPSSTCTSTTGNQTFTVSWTTPPGGPKFMNVFVANAGPPIGTATSCGNCTSIPGNLTSVVWSVDGVQFVVANGTVPLGGPSLLLPGTQGIETSSWLTGSLGGGFSSTASGTFTANRTVTIPDVNGTDIVSSYQNSFYDNFNRANGGVGSNYTNTLNTTVVSSNQVTGGSAGAWNMTAVTGINLFDPNQQASFTLSTIGAGNAQVTAALRSSSSAANGYICGPNTNSNTLFLQKMTAGATSNLNSTAATFVVGDYFTFTAVGTTLTCNHFSGGVLSHTISATDSTYTSGLIGLAIFSNVSFGDNFSGGNLHPIAQLDAEQDWTQPQHFTQPVTIGATNPQAGALPAASIYANHYLNNGSTPTCSVTGAGAGATCSASSFTGIGDFSGIMAISTGTTPGSSGTITLTFAQSYPAFGFCVFALGNNASSWNARATVIMNDVSISNTAAPAAWDNNAVNLTASQANSLSVNYVCGGK